MIEIWSYKQKKTHRSHDSSIYFLKLTTSDNRYIRPNMNKSEIYPAN